MERIGIYGGTFNPPHLGHIQAARCAVETLGLTKLLLITDRIAPHKAMPALSASPEQRLEMLELCSAGEERLEMAPDPFGKESFPGHFHILHHLVGVLTKDTPLEITPEQTIQVSAVLDLFYRSAAQHREISLEEIIP